MSENGDLTAMIGALDRKIDAVNGQISQARDEVAKASRKIDELNSTQRQMAGQIGSLRQELAHLSQAEQVRSAEITKRIKELESSVANNTALLAAQTGLLQQLVSAQKEEAARRQLEREKAQFVVRIAALLDTFKDGAVRYLFATKAIEACAARSIKSDSFESLADQKVASEVLNTLTTVKLRAIAADRIEAEHFCELTDLRRDISGFRENLLARQDMDDAIRKDLMARKKTEEEAVGALAAPEADAALSSRHAKRTWTGVIGTLLILGSGVSVLLRGAGGEWGNAPEILAACLGGACLIASRLYSDAHRVGKLANHQQELLAIQAKIDELASAVADWDHSAQAQVAAFEGRVGKASVGLPPRSATASMADILQHFIDAVQQGENSWRARHGEISLVAKS